MAGYVYRGAGSESPREIRPANWAKSGRKPGRPKGIPMLKPFDPAKCGTMPGWRQHRAHGQKECRACMDAQNEYMRQYTAKKKRKGAA